MNLYIKRMSHSTTALNVSAISTDACASGRGFAHALQAAHVSTISGIISSTAFATPALSSRFCIGMACACHHLRCSLRSVILHEFASAFLRTFKTRRRSKPVQSLLTVPVPASFHLRFGPLGWYANLEGSNSPDAGDPTGS